MMLSKLMAKLAPAVFSQRPTAALLRTIRVSRWEGTTRFRNRSVTASLLSLIAVCGVMLLTMGPGYGQLLPTVPVPGRPYTTLGPHGELVVHPSRAVANRIIVGLRPAVGPQQVQPLADRAGGQPIGVSPDGAIMIVALDEGTSLEEAIAAYQSQPEVAFATYDRLVYPVLTPNDPDLLQQYHHALCDSMDAWDVTTGLASVTIAVIDSGIDTDHPDISAKLWINSDETPGNQYKGIG